MKAQEILGYIIALHGGGLAAGCAGLTGVHAVMNAVPFLVPVLWILTVVGMAVLVAGLAIAANAEGKG
jgi:hypothetical protein